MAFYFLLLAGLMLLVLILQKREKTFIIISWSLLVLVYTIRAESVGWDTSNYVHAFKHIKSFPIYGSYLETGWVILNKIIYSINTDIRCFFFVIGAIAITLDYYIICKLSKNIYFSVLAYYMLGFYFNLMNQQRNFLAISICAISFFLLYKKKHVAAILVNLLAFTIHESALVFFIYMLTFKFVKKIDTYFVLIFVSCTMFVSLFFEPIALFISKYYFTSYFTEEKMSKFLTPGNLKMFTYYLGLFFICCMIENLTIRNKSLYRKSDYRNQNLVIQSDERLYLMIKFAILCGLFLEFISMNNHMVARFAKYFSFYLTIYIPNTIEQDCNCKSRSKWYLLFLIVLPIFMLIWLRFSENGMGRDGVIPYLPYWR